MSAPRLPRTGLGRAAALLGLAVAAGASFSAGRLTRDGYRVWREAQAPISTEPSDTGSSGVAPPRGDSSPEPQWVTIPGGVFAMGSDHHKQDEQPITVTALPSFEITRTEVTVKQYQACVLAGACTVAGTNDGPTANWGRRDRHDHPVNFVTWDQASVFCHWAGGRLPTEAEWEYAGRSAGRYPDYPWGDQEPSCKLTVMRQGGVGCGSQTTSPVCSRPNGDTDQGLCDMLGNVWEWTQDYYRSDYSLAPQDGSAQEAAGSGFRVLRGGSIDDRGDELHITRRRARAPADAKRRNGIRCAR